MVEKLKIARSSLDVILLGSCWSTAVRFFTDSWCQGREGVGLIVFFSILRFCGLVFIHLASML